MEWQDGTKITRFDKSMKYIIVMYNVIFVRGRIVGGGGRRGGALVEWQDYCGDSHICIFSAALTTTNICFYTKHLFMR